MAKDKGSKWKGCCTQAGCVCMNCPKGEQTKASGMAILLVPLDPLMGVPCSASQS